MDTSAEYIKMCETADEIQEPWNHRLLGYEPNLFDVVYYPKWLAVGYACDNSESRPSGGKLKIWFPDKDNKEIWFKISGKFFMFELIWLPRQDQLQEMLGAHKLEAMILLINQLAGVVCSNDQWIEKFYYRKCNSMEQLWLSFVMQKKFNKIWNGEEWEGQECVKNM